METKESITQSSCSGREPFALQVLDDSMMPEFAVGNIIVIDPEAVVKNGSFVLATYQGKYIFRQLHIDNQRYFLTALNPQYPDLPIRGLEDIHGIIIQGGGLRRKDRKRYD
jgi:SOS-response transcriptional repressor LexA